MRFSDPTGCEKRETPAASGASKGTRDDSEVCLRGTLDRLQHSTPKGHPPFRGTHATPRRGPDAADPLTASGEMGNVRANQGWLRAQEPGGSWAAARAIRILRTMRRPALQLDGHRGRPRSTGRLSWRRRTRSSAPAATCPASARACPTAATTRLSALLSSHSNR
jgi:hypothetical protein